MKPMRKIEIPLISFEAMVITIIMLALAGLVGCKDKAEAYEPEESRGITFEEDEIDITWEMDYPIDINFGEGVTFRLGEDNEIVCGGSRRKWLRIMYESMSGKEPTEKVVLRFTEPNEPEEIKVSICYKCPPTPNDGNIHFCPGHKQITDFIPTWPDYIELEKDLILRFDYPEPNNPLMKLIHTPIAYKIFSKGTKIYFKED